MGLFSSDENDFGAKKSKGVLYGTILTYGCDPEQDCKHCEATGKCPKCEGEGSLLCDECKGDGECHYCGGQGSSVCETCHGEGECQDCHGRGSSDCKGNSIWDSVKSGSGHAVNPHNAPHCGGSGDCASCHGTGLVHASGRYEKCNACGGSGKCRHCHGRGVIECDSCDGSGKCNDCHGSGHITCSKCDGSGRCHRCEGNGRLTCGECDGAGSCQKCGGHGRVQCPRCQGTGAYQKFTTYTIKGIRKDACFTGTLDCAKCIKEATGEVVFDGVQKKWARKGEVELDRTEEVNAIGNGCGRDLYSESQQLYQSFLDENAPKSESVAPYQKKIKIEKVRLAKIEYVVDEKPYVMYVMGDNNTVACEEVPKTIEALKLSFFEKTKLLAMTLFRKKEYAQLAYYIFKLDNVATEEQRMLNVAIKKCCGSAEEEEKFKEELKKFDPEKMPFEELRKQMKALFASKKLIAFVWQCIAVDKKVTPKEEEFFNKVVAEYKKVTPEQVVKIKGLSSRIAKLSDEEILDEYLTLNC